MFGLCMPTGETYLLMKGGKQESVMLSDEMQPRKHIMECKYVLSAINRVGYQNVDAIVYERNKHKTIVSMADYYAERGQEINESHK